MKIATFNINNVNRRLPNLLAWLTIARPDAVALQELKCADSAFPVAALNDAGYGAVWRGERTWNGVAILARGREPVLIRDRLPGDLKDDQARYIEAAVEGVVIASLYAPNGNPHPGPKFDYKMRWLTRLQRHAAALSAKDVPVVLAGDFNVVPTDFDIYPTASWANDALLQPKPRRLFAKLLSSGWMDSLRATHPGKPQFTFWDYKRNRWRRDAGLRLDHLLVSPALAARVVDAGVDRGTRGEEGASDHAPAWIKLKRMQRRARGDV